MAGLNPTDMTAIDMKKADAVSCTDPLTPPLLLELEWHAWHFSTYTILFRRLFRSLGLSICHRIGRALDQAVNSFPDKKETETIKDIAHDGWVFTDKDGVAQDQSDHDNANPPKDVCHATTLPLTS